MAKTIVLLMALGLSTAVQAQTATQQRPQQQREQPPPPPPPPGAEPAPEEAPPPEESQQQQQPPPPPPGEPGPQPENIQQEDLRRLHLAFGACGMALIEKNEVGLGFCGEVGAKLVLGELFNVRLFANYTYLEDTGGTNHFLLVSAEPTLSFGFYSAGIGVQLGVADFAGGIGGVVGGFVAPLKLRFGTNITAEVSVDLGAQLITSNPDGGFSPFGRIRFNIFL